MPISFMNPTDLPPRGGEESFPDREVGGVVDGGLGARGAIPLL
jgi:hypothetical protein